MKSASLIILSILALAMAGCSTPGKVEANLAAPADDLLFDATSLKNDLGAQTYFITRAGDTNIAPESARALSKSGIDKVTEVLILPVDALHPKPIGTSDIAFPKGYRPSPGTDTAKFLILIAADGSVRGLYCYQFKDRRFAVAVAESLRRWLYAPAKVQGRPVQVLTGLVIGPDN